MPSPIRPLGRETSDIFSLPTEYSTSKDPWGNIFERANDPVTAGVRSTEKQRSLLLDIWNNGDKSNIDAQKVAGVKDGNLSFAIPKHINAVNLAELAQAGLVVNQGNGLVKLTDEGKKELSREIMHIPSEIIKNKTRDRYIFCQMQNAQEEGYYLLKVPASINLQMVVYKYADGRSEVVKIVSIDDIKVTGTDHQPMKIDLKQMTKLPSVLDRGQM